MTYIPLYHHSLKIDLDLLRRAWQMSLSLGDRMRMIRIEGCMDTSSTEMRKVVLGDIDRWPGCGMEKRVVGSCRKWEMIEHR